MDAKDLQAVEQMLEHVRAQNLLRYVPSVVEHLVERELPALLRQAREGLSAADPPPAAPHLAAAATGDPPRR